MSSSSTSSVSSSSSSSSQAPQPPYIILNKRVTLVDEEEGTHRLQVWVHEVSDGIPGKIMVYQKYPSVPDYTEQPEDIFVHVASFADLAAFPPDVPDDRSPFYRKYYYDILFDALPALEDCWDLTVAHTKLLVEDVHRVLSLPPVSVIERRV
jgi:hypothetical protein